MSESCVKCGSEDLWTQYHKDGHGCSYAQRSSEGISCCRPDQPEHLHRGCRNCGFTWRDPVLS